MQVLTLNSGEEGEAVAEPERDESKPKQELLWDAEQQKKGIDVLMSSLDHDVTKEAVPPKARCFRAAKQYLSQEDFTVCKDSLVLATNKIYLIVVMEDFTTSKDFVKLSSLLHLRHEVGVQRALSAQPTLIIAKDLAKKSQSKYTSPDQDELAARSARGSTIPGSQTSHHTVPTTCQQILEKLRETVWWAGSLFAQADAASAAGSGVDAAEGS